MAELAWPQAWVAWICLLTEHVAHAPQAAVDDRNKSGVAFHLRRHNAAFCGRISPGSAEVLGQMYAQTLQAAWRALPVPGYRTPVVAPGD